MLTGASYLTHCIGRDYSRLSTRNPPSKKRADTGWLVYHITSEEQIFSRHSIEAIPGFQQETIPPRKELTQVGWSITSEEQIFSRHSIEGILCLL